MARGVMALIRLAFGNFLSCSSGYREALDGRAPASEIPTPIHSILGGVIEFEELRGNFQRSHFNG
jgi:hypothetical protein